MALKAQWNLVLRLLVDNGVKEKETCGYHLFGNVDFDFSDASGRHPWIELQLWKCLS